MYLNKIMIENMGAIEKFYLDKEQLIKEDGLPRVIILLGKNGTGKTTLMSSIVDALHELSNSAFSDVLPKYGLGHQYFKISGKKNLRINSRYGFSYLNFFHNESNYEYFDKNGIVQNLDDIDSKFREINSSRIVLESKLNEDISTKNITPTQDDESFTDDLSSNTYCYFPSDRYELPYWINKDTVEKLEQFAEQNRNRGYLGKDILVRESLEEIRIWILNVLLDSRATILIDKSNGRPYTEENLDNILLLTKSLSNIEEIISKILQVEIRLVINYRTHVRTRIKVIEKDTQVEVLPSLDSLSAGQSTLLSIFTNIIKYSDRDDLMKSINLPEIEGIVIIDEVDLHLHIELQHDVLPQLIKLFPKVQFIISSHSPFFLAGIAKEFNQNDYLMLNMPNGNTIEKIEDFEEFTKSYELFTNLTESHLKELDELRIEIANSTRPLIITEGKTDWKHLKSAFENLKNDYPNLDFEFYEYEDLNMGNHSLSHIIESYEKVPSNRKIIAIFDRDDESINKKYSNDTYKKINENLFAFCIPAISDELDKISIEYYYHEYDLKKLDNNERRLFNGLEFDGKLAISHDKQYITSNRNDAGKLRIIDSEVYLISNSENKKSVAMSKNDFAENILYRREGFESINFNNFRRIFDVIRAILNPTS